MLFRQIYDATLAQYTYLVGCQQTKEALIIDPERDIDRYLEAAASEGMRITAVTETHIHADFLSGSRDLGEATGAIVYLSDEGDEDWKYKWPGDSSARVEVLHDGDMFQIGHIQLQVLHTPGHTPEHICFVLTDLGGGASEPMGIVSGDFLFVGDLGRPDLLESAAGLVGAMEPAAERLWESTRLLEHYAPHLQIWPGHGAGSACGKALGAIPTSTLGYERLQNSTLGLAASGKEPFVQGILEGQPEPPLYFGRMKRENRDGAPPARTLSAPRVLRPEELANAARDPETILIDTRPDRYEFLSRHWPGSIWAPGGGTNFLAIAGSYIEPTDQIVLVGALESAEALTRALYRIGLDSVVGIASIASLEHALAAHGAATITSIGWDEVRQQIDSPDHQVLDVRRLSEFEAGSVPGSRNIAHTRLAARAGELDQEKQLLIHCRTGFRATAAAAYLERRGFKVAHIGSAFADWKMEAPIA
jgi:hydroxyacylglutathione hydrolase